MNLNHIETKIGLQCASLLMGIKLSNLLIVSPADKEEVVRIFKNTIISYHICFESQEKVVFLLYHKEQLVAYLNQPEVKRRMYRLGYTKYSLSNILMEMSKRYEACMLATADFPHELGFLLGYPVEDVIGFIDHQGKNYLYSGQWKVYHNVPERKKLFRDYDEAKEQVIRMIVNGVNVEEIIARGHWNQYKQICM